MVYQIIYNGLSYDIEILKHESKYTFHVVFPGNMEIMEIIDDPELYNTPLGAVNSALDYICEQDEKSKKEFSKQFTTLLRDNLLDKILNG
jgi:hypothetical protein